VMVMMTAMTVSMIMLMRARALAIRVVVVVVVRVIVAVVAVVRVRAGIRVHVRFERRWPGFGRGPGGLMRGVFHGCSCAKSAADSLTGSATCSSMSVNMPLMC
jgi:hypothetical protein